MDSNENNNDSVTVPDLDSTHVKIEPVEKCANPEAEDTTYSKLKQSNSIFKKQSQYTQLNQKRKVPEGSEVVMDNEDSQNSNESVKRRRYTNSQNEVPIANNSQSTAEKQTYTLLLTNSPGIWTSQEVINYVKDECGVHISSINDSREDNTEEDFQIRLRFETKEHLHQVLTKLKEKEAQGKLSVQLMDNVKDVESDAESDTTVQLQTNEPKTPQADENAGAEASPIADLDLKDFYIREDYLDTLGIKPPLTSWVIVTNFRCDKSELKEVLGLAGKVLICSVNMDSNKYANVMYSHPLEAVQAVSMLNGQQYYGKKLKVKMNNTTENKTLLPKGLVDVGPGLGKYGKPLPDLGDQYKRFLKGKPSNLDAGLFQTSFLKKIGITIDEEVAKFVRLVNTPSQNSHNDTDSERNDSPVDKNNAQKSESNFGPVGQKPGSNIPVIRPQNKAPQINKIPPRPQMQNPMPVPNPMQMRAPIRGPMPSGMGSRIPGPMPMGPGPRAGFPMANPGPMYPNCPPVPGLESGNDPSKNVNNMINGPRFPIPGPMSPMVGPGGPIVGPGGPMGGPNGFPGPGPMMGPRPGPMMGPRPGPIMGPRPGPVMGPRGPMPMTNGPIRPNMFWSNVRMFKGPDPVMLQITNLPPTTNFVNLGQKLTELGHVVFLELTNPGCANVRFASPADAERCFQNYRQVMG